MAAETSLFGKHLSELKNIENQHAGPKGKYLTSTEKLLAFKNEIQVGEKTPFKRKY
jgi:hypothetical protein